MDWYEIVALIATLVLGFLAGRKAGIQSFLTASGELLSAIAYAMKDGSISRDEAVDIMIKAKDVKEAVNRLTETVNR